MTNATHNTADHPKRRRRVAARALGHALVRATFCAIEHRLRRCLKTALLPLTLGLTLAFAAPAAAFDEYELKSAFLYRLPSFITWKNRPQSDEFTLCVHSPNEHMSTYAQLDGKKIGNKTVRFLRRNNTQRLNECDLLFIGAQVERVYDDLQYRLPEKDVLIVVETPTLLRENRGAIALIRDGKHVKIAINPLVTEDADLSIASDLLEVAAIVRKKN